MKVEKCFIEDLLIFSPKIYADERGYFLESYNKSKFKDGLELETDFVQDNESLSTYGTLRGLHFQKPPFAQAKLVRAITGTILDVVVDLREGSKTFGKSNSILLTGENKKQVYIPRGFAHGFVVLSESAIFSYKVDNYYNAESDSGIMWNDEHFNVDWKIEREKLIISEKDNKQQSFKDYCLNKVF